MQGIALFVPGFLALIAGIFGGIFSILIVTRDTETIALGALVCLCVLPSIVAFELLSKFTTYTLAPHIGFWFFIIVFVGYLYYLYSKSTQLIADDGSGQMALHILYATIGAASFSYLVLFYKLKY